MVVKRDTGVPGESKETSVLIQHVQTMRHKSNAAQLHVDHRFVHQNKGKGVPKADLEVASRALSLDSCKPETYFGGIG